ncbi:uncharacterized protein LOC128211035 [Mya arenaria]|uniref:uncharacterized protein LOC128211035 n=1 Tax=Mya arenaria TaxID=6604 RepID=UPI0022DECE43|nr:uncharacterized protein LOC128211035 [Mya arenaria]
MIRALHFFAFVALVAVVYSKCVSDADCPATACAHGEVASCELQHGTGAGAGENQCVCTHHGKRAGVPCTTKADCHGHVCPAGQHAACVSHGSGGQDAETYCDCL